MRMGFLRGSGCSQEGANVLIADPEAKAMPPQTENEASPACKGGGVNGGRVPSEDSEAKIRWEGGRVVSGDPQLTQRASDATPFWEGCGCARTGSRGRPGAAPPGGISRPRSN